MKISSCTVWGRAACLLALGLTLPALAHAQDDAEKGKPARRLTVNGQSQIKIQPDKAEITIGVVTEDKSSQLAVKANATAAQKVQDSLKKQGIPDKDIQTTNYSVQPLMTGQQFGGGGVAVDNAQKPQKPMIVGYRVYNQVRVTIRQLDRMGNVLDAATDAGSNTIEGIVFGMEDEKAASDQALEQAVQDARRKADRMVKAAGVTIVGVYEINETGMVRPYAMTMAKADAIGGASTPIAPGEINISANVTIVYQISEQMKAARQTHPTPNIRRSTTTVAHNTSHSRP